MTINFNKYNSTTECDYCANVEDEFDNEETFGEVCEEMRIRGWKTYKNGVTFLHKCPGCVADDKNENSADDMDDHL